MFRLHEGNAVSRNLVHYLDCIGIDTRACIQLDNIGMEIVPKSEGRSHLSNLTLCIIDETSEIPHKRNIAV